MNVLNRHGYFGSLLGAWSETGNPIYPRYFSNLVEDWVTHLPCNNAATKTNATKCTPLGAKRNGVPTCQWDNASLGGSCMTGTFESPWRSLEMGVRMASPWPSSFFGFQQSPDFSIDARVLMLLGVSEHFKALLVDGGHPGRGTVNWEMTQWLGLLIGAGAWPEITGAAEAVQASFHYLKALLQSGVYPDGVEIELAAGYDMGTANEYFGVLNIVKEAGLPPPDPSFISHVEAMWNYGAYVADPSGCLPRNGDSDICGTGYSAHVSAFFNRTDWDYVYTNGKTGRAPTHETPSVMFPWAGQAVLRSGYDRDALWCWFDVGPFGSNPFHANRDKLNVLLHAYDSMFLVDSGRFAYSGNSFSHARRPYAHATYAHNTLRIDGKEQAQAPSVARSPRPNSSWSFAADRDIVQGSMSLWERDFVGRATHSRTVYHQRGSWLVVVDVVTSDRGGRSVQATWHTHPNASVTLATNGVAIVGGVNHSNGQPTPAQVAVIPEISSWSSAKTVRGQLAGHNTSHDQGWFSAHYDDASPSTVLVYDVELSAEQKQKVFVWLLVPSPDKRDVTTDSVEVTGVRNGTVQVSVRVAGKPSQLEVPFEGMS